MRQNKKESILKYAEQLLLSKGYNGFSFMDIANKIGIRKASLHYYFPTKEDLAVHIVKKYRDLFQRWRDRVSDKNTTDKVSSFFSLYHSLYRKHNQICPIGMLLAEYSTIPILLREEVKLLHEEEKDWMISILKSGIINKEISDNVNPQLYTDLVTGYLSGAIKFWRIYANDDSYYLAKDHFLTLLKD